MYAPSRGYLTLWARSALKKSGSHIFYQMTHFMAFLDSSHQGGSNCRVNFFIVPIFDQVRRHTRKSTSGTRSWPPESFGHQLHLTKVLNNTFSTTATQGLRRNYNTNHMPSPQQIEGPMTHQKRKASVTPIVLFHCIFGTSSASTTILVCQS